MMPSYPRAAGQVEIVALVFLAIFIAVSSALTSYVVTNAHAEQVRLARSGALALAEAGVDEAVNQLNKNAGYTGETDTALGAGTFTVAVSSIDTTTKSITATGYVPSRANPTAAETVTAQLSNDSSIVSFRFGVQVGDGGAVIGNGAEINGNLYSNGNVCDSANCSGSYAKGAATVSGDATVAAGTQSSPDQSWTTQNTGLNLGDVSGHANLAQSFVLSQTDPLNKVSLYLKKTGTPGDITLEIVADSGGHPGTTALTTGNVNAANVTNAYGFADATMNATPTLTAGQTYWIIATVPVSATDYYVWGGDSNDGYPKGTASYASSWTSGSWTSASADADFKAYLGGVATKIHGITVGGTAWAATLENCGIGGDAYYQSTFSCTLTGGGTTFPNSNPAIPAAMPISIAQIRAWESTATAVGIRSGDYTIAKGDTVTLGPGTAYGEIDGNLTVNGTLRLTGPVWVKGNVSGGTNAAIIVDGSTGKNGAQIIADVPGSKATAGTVNLLNNMTLSGNGNPGSYLMIMTTNTGSTALQIANNANTVILYAPNGTIQASENSSTYQVTANRLVLANNVEIIYQAGLQSEHFSSGPGGSWSFLPGTYSIKP